MKKELIERINNSFEDVITSFSSIIYKSKEKYIASPEKIKVLETAFKKKRRDNKSI